MQDCYLLFLFGYFSLAMFLVKSFGGKKSFKCKNSESWGGRKREIFKQNIKS